MIFIIGPVDVVVRVFGVSIIFFHFVSDTTVFICIMSSRHDASTPKHSYREYYEHQIIVTYRACNAV